MRKQGLRIIAAFAVVLASSAEAASPTTGSLGVQITIEADCQLAAGTTLNFGTRGALVANVDQSADLSITCTPSTTFNVGLNAGANPTSAGNVNGRRMENGGSYVSYQLYSDSGYGTVWGNTIGSNTVASTGTGSAQTFTVYGRVPPQATPAAGATYSDTITVTMTF
jgi:spore coat protein U-like protein